MTENKKTLHAQVPPMPQGPHAFGRGSTVSLVPETPAEPFIPLLTSAQATSAPLPVVAQPGVRVFPPSPQENGRDRYKYERLIAEGGFGELWLIYDPGLRRNLALKLLKQSQTSVDRFLAEMTILARIDNEHVVKIHSSGELTNGSLYYVMEYLRGRNLEEEIDKNIERGYLLTWEFVCDVFLQMCDGLAAIHRFGIIHRDLKPQNCMLTMQDNVHSPIPIRRLKLIDLGIAKRISSESTGRTEQGMILGSISYLSPEQAEGKVQELTYSSDIYSLGLILYQMLTGWIPHVTGMSDEWRSVVFRRMLAMLPPPLHAYRPRPTFPEKLESIIRRCLQPSPRDRFQSVLELRDAIVDADREYCAEFPEGPHQIPPYRDAPYEETPAPVASPANEPQEASEPVAESAPSELAGPSPPRLPVDGSPRNKSLAPSSARSPARWLWVFGGGALLAGAAMLWHSPDPREPPSGKSGPGTPASKTFIQSKPEPVDVASGRAERVSEVAPATELATTGTSEPVGAEGAGVGGTTGPATVIEASSSSGAEEMDRPDERAAVHEAPKTETEPPISRRQFETLLNAQLRACRPALADIEVTIRVEISGAKKLRQLSLGEEARLPPSVLSCVEGRLAQLVVSTKQKFSTSSHSVAVLLKKMSR